MLDEVIIRQMMKTWLRLLLVAVTVGGGFTGIVMIADLMASGNVRSAVQMVILLIFLALYAFVTVSGLLFVHNEKRTGPLSAALALQIPWISCPCFVYQFAAGLYGVVALETPENPVRTGIHFAWNLMLGTHFIFRISGHNDFAWSFGINAAAVLLIFLLRRSNRSSPLAQTHQAIDPSESAAL